MTGGATIHAKASADSRRFFACASGGAYFQRMPVPNLPDSEKEYFGGDKNRSMNVWKVLFYYIGILAVCIVFVKMLYELVTKKYKKKLAVDDVHQNAKIQYFQTFFWIAGVIFSGICVFTIGVSGFRDLPYVLKNQYPHVIGNVVEVDKTSHGDFSVVIENEITKERVDIGFLHKGLKEGEKVEVYYLPHLKIGSVYKIQQN